MERLTQSQLFKLARRAGGAISVKRFNLAVATMEFGDRECIADTVAAFKVARMFRHKAAMVRVRQAFTRCVLAVRTVCHSLIATPRTPEAKKGGDDSGGGGGGDSGDDGEDDPDSDLSPRQKAAIAYLRSIEGRRNGILEQTYRRSILEGCELR